MNTLAPRAIAAATNDSSRSGARWAEMTRSSLVTASLLSVSDAFWTTSRSDLLPTMMATKGSMNDLDPPVRAAQAQQFEMRIELVASGSNVVELESASV